MLYQLHEFNHAMVAPWRAMSQFTRFAMNMVPGAVQETYPFRAANAYQGDFATSTPETKGYTLEPIPLVLANERSKSAFDARQRLDYIFAGPEPGSPMEFYVHSSEVVLSQPIAVDKDFGEIHQSDHFGVLSNMVFFF